MPKSWQSRRSSGDSGECIAELARPWPVDLMRLGSCDEPLANHFRCGVDRRRFALAPAAQNRLWSLPGDIVIERENFRFHFPIVTSLIISVVLSLILWLLNR